MLLYCPDCWEYNGDEKTEHNVKIEMCNDKLEIIRICLCGLTYRLDIDSIPYLILRKKDIDNGPFKDKITGDKSY